MEASKMAMDNVTCGEILTMMQGPSEIAA